MGKFSYNFSNQLKSLYQQSFLGNKNSDFAVVEIWQYFNEQIKSDLNAGFKNEVVILTDGYFDFEDKQHGFKDKQHSTTTTPFGTTDVKEPILNSSSKKVQGLILNQSNYYLCQRRLLN